MQIWLRAGDRPPLAVTLLQPGGDRPPPQLLLFHAGSSQRSWCQPGHLVSLLAGGCSSCPWASVSKSQRARDQRDQGHAGMLLCPTPPAATRRAPGWLQLSTMLTIVPSILKFVDPNISFCPAHTCNRFQSLLEGRMGPTLTPCRT